MNDSRQTRTLLATQLAMFGDRFSWTVQCKPILGRPTYIAHWVSKNGACWSRIVNRQKKKDIATPRAMLCIRPTCWRLESLLMPAKRQIAICTVQLTRSPDVAKWVAQNGVCLSRNARAQKRYNTRAEYQIEARCETVVGGCVLHVP